MTDKKQKIQVLHSNGELEIFRPRLIKEQLLKETDISEEDAQKIQIRVAEKIRSMNKNEVSTSTIRSEVSAQLISRKLFDAEEDSRVIGVTMDEIYDLIVNPDRSNANQSPSSESVLKYTNDKIFKQLALREVPERLRKAHIEKFIKIHDLEGLGANIRPHNCFTFDLDWFKKNGLIIDPNDVNAARAHPAKHLSVLLNHALQALQVNAQQTTGGSGFSDFSVKIAPFIVGMDYKEVKQNMQNFFYNSSMILISKAQVVFSSIGIDIEIPDYMKDMDAIGPGGVVVGKYADFEKENDIVVQAILEVMEEGWGEKTNPTPFLFPNVIFNLNKKVIDNPDKQDVLLRIHKYISNFWTPYIANIDIDGSGGASSIMGALSSDTPVMTDKGFKYPYELKIGDTVMTYSSDGSKCWNKIYNVIEKEAPDKVFKITCDNGYSFKVTDNHKLPTLDGIVKSEDLKVGMELYDYVDEPFEPVDDYEAEFIGIFLADGFIRHKPRHQKNGNDIEFHVRKEWKSKEIIRLCEKLSYNYEFIICEDGSYKVLVKEKELRDKLVKLYDDNLGVKRFPSEYWKDENKIANIIKGLMFDGRKGSKTRWVWSCSDKEVVYDFCYAISLLGLKSTIYEDARKGSTGNWRTNYMVSFGKNFNPKNATKIKSIELVNNSEPVYDLSIENNPNYVCGLGGIHSENCRSRLNNNLDTVEDSIYNCGNLAYFTINLPKLGYLAKNKKEFFELLDYYLDIVDEGLLYRRDMVQKALDEGLMDFHKQTDKNTGRPLYEIERQTLTFGLLGINEALMNLYGFGVKDHIEEAEEILQHVYNHSKEFGEKYNVRSSVIMSPAESTTSEFADFDKEKYPDIITNGVKGAYYYTNGHDIPIDEETDIYKHIENACRLQKYATGGDICHLWTSGHCDPKSLLEVTKYAINNGIGFLSYSGAFTVCKKCGATSSGELNECEICGNTNLVVYKKICFDGSTKIYIKKEDKIRIISLEDFYNLPDWDSYQTLTYSEKEWCWTDIVDKVKNANSDFINLKFTKGYDLTCTPDHEFYKYTNGVSQQQKITANELNVKDSINNHRILDIAPTNIKEDFRGTLIGFILGDGHIDKYGNILFTFTKIEKSDYLKHILSKTNVKYTFKENNGKYKFWILPNQNKNNELINMLSLLGDKRELIDFDYSWDMLLGIYSGLINSDGSVFVEKRKNNQITKFCQVDEKILWFFFDISILLGTRPSISFQNTASNSRIGLIELRNKASNTYLDKIYLRDGFSNDGDCIDDTGKNLGSCMIKEKHRIEEKGNSYCITVASESHNTLFNGVLASNCGYFVPLHKWCDGRQQQSKDRYLHSIK